VTTFHLLDPTAPAANRRDLFSSRPIPPALGSLREAARFFQPSDDLVAAVNVALSVGAPLLLTGEPGTGKTQVGHYLAYYFGLPPEGPGEPDPRFFQLDVRSTTTAADLLYQFDTVAYFHAAHDPVRDKSAPLDRGQYIRPGPLWKALEAKGPSLVLLDEIDKAPRDFPNDLLGVLSESRFHVPEQDRWVDRPPGQPPPFLVITSNSERRLPEPFLRRCIFHHIEFTEELLRRAVAARRADYQGLDERTIGTAVERFLELRTRNLRKKPATAELLVWLAVLAAQGGATADRLSNCALGQLPALSVLVKDQDDFRALL
jgi:MoxR-like ATPase